MLEGHTAPIAALAASPDGATLASASWDQTVRLWPLAGGAARVLEGHAQNVNGVAFAPDGRTLVSVSYDQSLRIWPLSGSSSPTIVAMPSPLNAVTVGDDGEIVAGGADGKLYFLSGAGAAAGEIAAGPKPVISIAISPDGALVAAASIGGSVAVIDRLVPMTLRKVAVVLHLSSSHEQDTGDLESQALRLMSTSTSSPRARP